MEKDKVVYPYILEYMRKIRRGREGSLGELEKKAREEDFPISEPEMADLLDIICRLKKPERILEIGTCIGFSALLMTDACPGVHIDTIERNPKMIKPAKENFSKFNAGNINLMEGSALDILRTLDDKYDLIFIDAAKGQYPYFLPHCRRLLNTGGIMVADNVFFNGYVATGIPDVRRNRTIVNRLDEYMKELQSYDEFHSVILPISDGVTLSYKMK